MREQADDPMPLEDPQMTVDEATTIIVQAYCRFRDGWMPSEKRERKLFKTALKLLVVIAFAGGLVAGRTGETAKGLAGRLH